MTWSSRGVCTDTDSSPFYILHSAFCILHSFATRIGQIRISRVAALFVFLTISTAFAQDDPLARARDLARAGNRAEALAILESRLAAAPADADARTLYGIVLSWEGRYDDARRELRRAIDDDPIDLDARLALIRVEIWSGNADAAAALIDESLVRFPAKPELLELRNQIRRNPPAREVRAGFVLDEPEPGETWREAFASVSLPTSLGPVIGRAGRASRGGDEGFELSAEAYPRIDPKSYLWLQASISDDSSVYADWRLGAEAYRSFARYWEASIGYRRLEFEDGVDLFTASLGRYAGAWLILARGFATEDDSAAQLGARRYFGEEGRDYVGFRLARGSAREQIRTDIDLAAFETTEVALETRLTISQRFLAELTAGYGSGDDGDPDRLFVAASIGARF
ncbi:MAG TPA: YaiO family outer membrane beta-barrel protein [Thermoanaerobaculia bacterium]